MKKALLVLEDGTVYTGSSFGASGEVTAEVVFNTSLTGYQEVLTDPSYKGQMVAMTYPLIGNYGICLEDEESRQIFVEAFIVKECSRIYSNWRADMSLPEYLIKQNIIGIEGIDTRSLTKRIREVGAMKGIVSTEDLDPASLLKKVKAAPGIEGVDLVKEVTCKKPYSWNTDTDGKEKKGSLNCVVIDCGVKYNILRELVNVGFNVRVVPADTSADDILKMSPDGLMLANGPGDPAAVPYVVETVKKLIGKVPIFGICFGHQMLGLAMGGKTYKLKFGHHGGNQPVKDLKTGAIAISVQNHCFCVDIDSLPKGDVEITHINLNDKTLEGIEYKKYPVFSVQFHPEAAPGPNDAKYLFKKFRDLVKNHKGVTADA
jgi:carbamoyl-phosphate synthase small subunit